MQIFIATRQDVPAINEIVNHNIRTGTSNWAWEERSLEEAYGWFEAHDVKGLYPLYVMKHDNKVVGFASLSPFREKAGYWPVAENTVYVHDDYQKRGIGRALMEKIIEHALQSGLKVITAWIDSTNGGSILMHEKLGFYHVGEMKDIGEKWNKSCSVTIMQLDIKKMEKEHDGKASNVC